MKLVAKFFGNTVEGDFETSQDNWENEKLLKKIKKSHEVEVRRMYTIQIATFDDIPNWKTIEVLDLPVVSFSNLHLRKTRVTVLLKLPATMEIETWLSES